MSVSLRCSRAACGWLCAVFLLLACGSARPAELHVPQGVTTNALPHHIELTWQRPTDTEVESYVVERAYAEAGPFEAVGQVERGLTAFTDYRGDDDRAVFYRVRQLGEHSTMSPPSAVVSSKPAPMDDDALLDAIQRACFRYFWDFGHPVSGLARAGTKEDRDICVSGGTGFGMITIVVGTERGFVSREDAAQRLLKMVTFLGEDAERFHGAWSHRLNGRTGSTIEFFNPNDNGGDLPETAFLIQGMLTARAYFDQDNAVENELRERITRLWHEVEWGWYLRYPEGKVLYWHWSPDQAWVKNHPLHGYNECMITYLLGIASPTHSIPDESYREGWMGKPQYFNEQTHYGLTQKIGRSMAGPLFLTQYSFLGLDPRAITDDTGNYHEHNRVFSLMHHRYAIDNPKHHAGYNEKCWGLTSSQNPNKGYLGHAPLTDKDDGTIAPTAALSAFAYTPEESLAAAKHFYFDRGRELWGPFGFYDAFNPGQNWVSPHVLAIDVGPIAPMIENHRTALCWRLFMSNPEIVPMLERLGIYTEPTDQP